MSFKVIDLKNELVQLELLSESHFDLLYEAASDYRIWVQHPERNRHEKAVFTEFFKSAFKSVGAYVIKDRVTMKVIGSTRFYQFNEFTKSIAIGYTFLTVDYWGGTYNRAVKELMLSLAFEQVETVIFHVGKNNIRSQKAVMKLGARLYGESEFESTFNQPSNFEYRITKEDWINDNDLYD